MIIADAALIAIPESLDFRQVQGRSMIRFDVVELRFRLEQAVPVAI